MEQFPVNNKIENNKFRYSLPYDRISIKDEYRASNLITAPIRDSILIQANPCEYEEDLQDTDEMINISYNNNLDKRSLAIKESSFQKFKPKDEVIDKGMSHLTVISQGIQLILIDDHSNTFYPFFSFVINEFKYTDEYYCKNCSKKS